MTSFPLGAQFLSIGFIGVGNMAGAIVRGICSKRLIAPSKVRLYDRNASKSTPFETEYNCHAVGSLKELVVDGGPTQTLMLCVKPQGMQQFLQELEPMIFPDQRVVSVAAGIKASTISSLLGKNVRVIRVMPNTPVLLGAGASGVAAGPNATQEDVDAVLALFNAVGVAIDVEERLIDSVAALSGSGPAHFLYLIEAMIAEGIQQGLTKKHAHQLAIQTCLGAGQLASQSEVDPAELRRRVTSPGGSTEAALNVFDDEGLRQLIARGMRASVKRNRELGE